MRDGVANLFGSLGSLGSSAETIQTTHANKIRKLIQAGKFSFPYDKFLLARARRLGRIHQLKFARDNNIVPEKAPAPQLRSLMDLVELFCTSVYKRQSQMHLRDLRDVVDLFEIKLPWQLKLIVLQFAGLVHVGKRRRCLSWVVYS